MESSGVLKHTDALGPTSRDSDLIGLAWGLGMEVFLKLSIVFDM